jgi:hypothetical protein
MSNSGVDAAETAIRQVASGLESAFDAQAKATAADTVADKANEKRHALAGFADDIAQQSPALQGVLAALYTKWGATRPSKVDASEMNKK